MTVFAAVATGCGGNEAQQPLSSGELRSVGEAVVASTSKVTMCNLPRYSRQPTQRLCGYTTPGTDASPIAVAWFTVDGSEPIPVTPGNGGFVDTSTILSEGTHGVRLYARSTLGNITFEEKTVTVDLTPPLLRVLSPTSADTLESTVVAVTSSVSDTTPVQVQTQWVQSSLVASGTGTVTHTIDLVNRGCSALLVRATDAAGNVTEVRTPVYVRSSFFPRCSTTPEAICGDGLQNGSEVCDDGNTTTETSCPYGQTSCTACSANCSQVLSLSGASCGDGVRNGPEACDDGNNGTETSCPYGQGSCTACSSDCSTVLNLTGAYCGDGVRSDNEACDDGNTITENACPYGQAACTACSADCSQVLSLTGAYCGDGVLNGPEVCDDGNTVSETSCPLTQTDCNTCNATCTAVLTQALPPPNIHFLIDTSGSMQEFPQVIRSDHDAFFQKGDTNALDPTHTGCNNTDLLAVESSRAWDYTKVYPVPDTGTGFGSDTGHPDLFKDDKVYAYMTWGDSNSPSSAWDNQDNACKFEYPLYASTQAIQYNNCKQCLQEKGFFKKPGINNYGSFDLFNSSPNTVSSIGTILGNAGKGRFAGWDSSGNPVYIVETRPYFIFTGRFLNFNPPRYVTAKAVMKQVIANMTGVRVGISQFYNDSDDTKDGAALVRGQNPSCDQIIKNSRAFDSNRGSYVDQVDALTFRTGTPLAQALMHVGEYFSSSDDVYKTKFGFSDFNYKKEFQNDSLTSQGRSWCWGGQVSSVIIITDGDPSDSDKLPSTTWSQIQKLNGNKLVTCPVASDCQYSDKRDYQLDDVAKMLATQDLQQSSPVTIGDLDTAGKQSLRIHTIGFGIDSPLLMNLADVGNGTYYTASDAKTLKDSLLSIIQNSTH